MNKNQQELIRAARKKLEMTHDPIEQRELILRTLDMLLDLAPEAEYSGEKNGPFSSISEHENLLAIIQQQIDELDALKRISFNLTSSLQMQAVLEAIVSEAMHLIKNAQGVRIFQYQEGLLTFSASLDANNDRDQPLAEPRPEGLTYTVARSRQAIVVDDMRDHPLFKDAPVTWEGSILGIPLMIGENVVGVMNLARRQAGGFSRSELRLLELLADQAALAIMNARLHEAVASQALSDALTGLPNRRALDVRLEEDISRSLRYGHPFAVIMMDLDGFKFVNDTFGHATGDQILRQYAQFLAKAKRSSDFLARYGGDEMMMILPETDLEAARKVAQNISARVSEFRVSLPDGQQHCLNLSGGIAIFPTHASSASDMLRAADEALYRAKRQARGTFLVAEAGGNESTPPNTHL